MAEFVLNQDITTTTPTIEVTVSRERPLPVGRHQFRLIVADDSGNSSVPDTVLVTDKVSLMGPTP